MAGVQLAGVWFGYRRGRAVIRGVDWRPGRRGVLLGPNGAGKSTLFGVASGAHRPTAGTITLDGRPVRRGTIGWMPQAAVAVPGLRAREQVALAGWMDGMGRASAWGAAASALEAVGLADHSRLPAHHLSGGQLRRLALAEVLVGEPQVVLLDEPTVGLDPAQRDDIRRLLVDLGERCQVVVATHLVEDIDHGFDTVTVLDGGAIRFDGTVAEFRALADPGARDGRASMASGDPGNLVAAYRTSLRLPARGHDPLSS